MFQQKLLEKSIFHGKNDWSGYGPAGQFWLLESALSPTFHGLRKERLAQWAPICVQNTTKNALPIMSLTAYASATKYP